MYRLFRLSTPRLFALLAAVLLTVIAATIALMFAVTGRYDRAIAKGDTYGETLVALDRLGAAALAADAPGNEVFRSRDPETEAATLVARRAELLNAVHATSAWLAANPAPELRALSADLDRLAREGDAMGAMGADVIALYAAGKADAAAARMAQMDAKLGEIEQIRQGVRTALHDHRAAISADERGLGDGTRVAALVIAGIAGLLSIAGILAARKVSERETAAAVEQERGRVAERRSQELELVNRHLSESNRDLEDFARVASHDLQEPLRKVQMWSDRLETRFGDALGSDGVGYLDRMRNATARMQTLIDDLLSLSRVTSQAEPFVATDLERVISGVCGDLEAAIERSGATIAVTGLPTLEADPRQMRQLFQNLIGNGIKFRRPDTAPRIEVHGSDLGDGRIRVTVSDDGIGFDQHYAEQIFGVFQRLHGRSDYEGSGVGLSIVRRIAERHGGTVVARSAPGEGATFEITLPRRQSDVVALFPQTRRDDSVDLPLAA